MSPSIPTSYRSHGGWTRATAAIAAWFTVALVGSVLGAFDSRARPPILLGAAALLPVLAFAITYARSQPLRSWVTTSADLRLLTLAHIWRLAGVVFIILYARGLLPGSFALSAGLGDMAIGATAPLVAWLIHARGANLPRRALVVWNLLGLADLITAVGLGVLSSQSRIGVLAAGGVTTRLMGTFPLALIPTFFVPLLAILHLVALTRLAHLQTGQTSRPARA